LRDLFYRRLGRLFILKEVKWQVAYVTEFATT
jgi:hypothetical protein